MGYLNMMEERDIMSRFVFEFVRAMQFMKSRIVPFSIGILGMSLFYASISVVESYMVKNIIDATVERDMSLLMQGIIMIVVATAVIIVFIPTLQYMYNFIRK